MSTALSEAVIEEMSDLEARGRIPEAVSGWPE